MGRQSPVVLLWTQKLFVFLHQSPQCFPSCQEGVLLSTEGTPSSSPQQYYFCGWGLAWQFSEVHLSIQAGEVSAADYFAPSQTRRVLQKDYVST